MDITTLKSTIEQAAQRIPATRGRGEEVTKYALIMPIITALGYDIHDPSEVCPEFDAGKAGGAPFKVDWAIFNDGSPIIFVEAKSIDESLDNHTAQLATYFNSTVSVVIGILTNGVEWRLFSDTQNQNIMDPTPFASFKIDCIDEHGIETLSQIAKDRQFVDEIRLTAKFTDYIRREIDIHNGDPSDNLVQWVLRGLKKEGREVTKFVDSYSIAKFRPIVKVALARVVQELTQAMSR